MAYDSAAIKLRSGDSYHNLPWTNITIQEPNFQDHHTTEAVLNMIKEGSYETKFADYVRSQSSNIAKEARFELRSGRVDGGVTYQQLFQKELTPSGVGKLNRLVIPKKHATKYFPQVSEESTVGEDGTDGFQLVFLDRRLRSRKFRYCYWKSSQSYVFTRGWNRFEKEKELKAKDLVTFYKCDCVEGFKEEKSFCMIDVSYNGGESEGPYVVEGFGDWGGKGKVELKVELGLHFDLKYDKEGEDEEVIVEPVAKKAVKLFGVEIG